MADQNNQQQNNTKAIPADQITSLLGIDPLKVDRSSSALSSALEKVQKELAEKAQQSMEKEVRELVTLVQEKNRLENEFKGKVAEADKKIAKIFNRLNGVKTNTPVVEPVADEPK